MEYDKISTNKSEVNMNERKEKSNYLIIGVIVAAIVIILILVIIWFFTNNRETIISEDADYGSISSLECETTKSEDAFFKPYDATRVKHRIVSTFKGDNIDDMSYDFEGTYNSEEKATNAEAWLHADYNLHFRDTGVSPETYSSNFVITKSKVKILVYAEHKQINKVIAPLFYLTGDDYDKIWDYSGKELKKVYEEKGFTCTFRE